MSRERFLTAAEALGEDVVARLAQLEDQVLTLDQLVANADLTEKYVEPIDFTAMDALARYVLEHGEEGWAFARTPDDRIVCVDDVPPLDERKAGEAIVFPATHMQLVGWWLAHAWRFCDLVGTAVKTLNSWNITTAAVLSRALIEEVGCVLYEADEISKLWAKAKSLPVEGRDAAVGNLFRGKLLEFTLGSKGLKDAFGDAEAWKAPNVMEYVRKLVKRSGSKDFGTFYDFLSNAAHPSRYAKLAYQTSWSIHETGAYGLRRRARQPNGENNEFPIAWGVAEATLLFGGEGLRLLTQALVVVDDFGLTTRSGELTLHSYWRKLMPGQRSSDACPCGCGKWRAAKHQWGQPAPEIRLTS